MSTPNITNNTHMDSNSSDDDLNLPLVAFPIQDFSDEVRCKIYGYLPNRAIEAMATTSPNLRHFIIPEKIRETRIELTAFLEAILTVLDEDSHAKQITSLSKVLKLLKKKEKKVVNGTMDIPSLTSLKRDTLSIREKIIKVLLTLDDDVLASLKELVVPAFFKNIFIVAEIRKLPPNARGTAFIDPYLKLVQAGDIARASDLAKQITSVDTLRDISSDLAMAGYIAESIEVLEHLSGDFFALVIKNTAKVLLQEKGIECFKSYINVIPEDLRLSVIENTSSSLLLSNNHTGAIEVLEFAHSENLCSEEDLISLIHDLSQGLVAWDDFEGFFKITRILTDEFKLQVLNNIIKGMTESCDIKEIIEIFKKLPEDWITIQTIQEVVEETSYQLALAGHIDEVIKVLNYHLENELIMQTIENMSYALAMEDEVDNMNGVIELAEHLPVKNRIQVLEKIAGALDEGGRFELAEEIWEALPEEL